MADYTRSRWLSIRNTRANLRALDLYAHVSKPLVTVMGPDGIPRRAVTPQPGTTLKLGRNKAKRLLRAGRPRKHWRTLARAG